MVMQGNNKFNGMVGLPNPDILSRYESVSPGMSDRIVELIQKEQELRHSMYSRFYCWYRFGRIIGFFCLSFILIMSFLFFNAGESLYSIVLLLLVACLMLMNLAFTRSHRTMFSHSNGNSSNKKRFSGSKQQGSSRNSENKRDNHGDNGHRRRSFR